MAPLTLMADSINAGTLPADLPAYAGYVDGAWPSFASICQRFYPRAHCVSITALGGNARICDCEAGDLTPAHAALWLVERIPRELGGAYDRHSTLSARIEPVHRAGIYAPESLIAELHVELSRIAPSLVRSAWVLWVAKWTGKPPATLPTGWDAQQWAGDVDAAYDLSSCAGDFHAQ